MGDGGSPLDWEEAPTEAARLVILLLPVEDERAAGGTPVSVPLALSGPASTGRRPLPAVSPEFVTYYHAEMPALVGFLIKCGAHHRDAEADAQEAFLELYEQWPVRSPRKWLRATAFRLFLRRPVEDTSPAEVARDLSSPSGTPAQFGFGAEENLLLDALELLTTVQRAVLALHYDHFGTRDIALILGMRQKIVRKNRERGRGVLQEIFEPRSERPRPGGERPAGEAGEHIS